ncbi:MAG: peptidoglycan recognition family protein [Candidatus Riflebacteria bacterium]|nr:peptidoglycan recognition family protein [Candidatus Riflebacteria bacterium]
MKRLKTIYLLTLLVAFFVPAMVSATVDVPDVLITGEPDFTVVDSTYGQFETEIMEMTKPVNNLIVAVDMQKAEKAMVRCYARFKYANTGRWGSYLAFDAEYHFSAIDPVSACQLMFIVRDPERGKTTVSHFAIQGNYLEESKMQWFMQKPDPFKSKSVWAKPTVVARSAWGARPAKSAYTPHVPQRLIVHHSYLPAQATYKGASTIRGIQNYHMDDPKTSWADIGYHFLIGPEGVIYQGRPEGVVGAHCSPNTNSVGICVIGNYDENADKLNPKIEESLLNLLSWLASTYKINPEVNLYGHCDFAPKSCPGAIIYKKLPQYKTQILKNIN